MQVPARFASLVLMSLAACRGGGECPPASQSTPVTSPQQVDESSQPSAPAPIEAASECLLSSSSIRLSAVFDVESYYLGAGGHESDGTYREYVHVNCTQCIGEQFSYGDCKPELSWSCAGVRMRLGALDQGQPLRGKDVYMFEQLELVSNAEGAVDGARSLLEKLADPERYDYFGDERKAAIRGVATRVAEHASKLRRSRVREIPPGEKRTVALIGVNFIEGDSSPSLIAIQDGKAYLLYTRGVAKVGVTDCGGD